MDDHEVASRAPKSPDFGRSDPAETPQLPLYATLWTPDGLDPIRIRPRERSRRGGPLTIGRLEGVASGTGSCSEPQPMVYGHMAIVTERGAADGAPDPSGFGPEWRVMCETRTAPAALVAMQAVWASVVAARASEAVAARASNWPTWAVAVAQAHEALSSVKLAARQPPGEQRAPRLATREGPRSRGPMGHPLRRSPRSGALRASRLGSPADRRRENEGTAEQTAGQAPPSAALIGS